MALSIRDSRLRRIEERLRRVGIASAVAAEDSSNAQALEREIAAYELAAAAQLFGLSERYFGRAYDLVATAAGWSARFDPLNREHWPAMFDQARRCVRRTSSDSDWPRRSASLERLIEAVQAS